MTDLGSDRWKHQESSSDDRAVAETSRQDSQRRELPPESGNFNHPEANSVGSGGTFEVCCGPLINYQSTSTSGAEIIWHGTVLVVAEPSQLHPLLKLRSWTAAINGAPGAHTRAAQEFPEVQGQKLYEDSSKVFWRFKVNVPLQIEQSSWQYSVTVPNIGDHPWTRPRTFVVPGQDQSMRIMFHSCNGFSVGTDEEQWSGPALWNDVLRVHGTKPFHVMIGGGDQIYNDGVRVGGPLKAWTDIANPKRRRAYPFDEQLRDQCDRYYYDNYIKWYSTGAFAAANAQIPQLNIFDDHDIIDGFGSYTEHFMQCAVFRGIGSIAFKYYCLFQHHVPPQEAQTYTTSKTETPEKGPFVLKEQLSSNYIVGKSPGPYITLPSHSLYTELGARIAFLGIDARTERTRHQVNYPETYDLIFTRLAQELSSKPRLNHLIVLLGVPIAYPRLAWLENIFKSPIIGPIRFLNKRFGLAGGLFNHFDGSVDLLDDLDDHYTARQHKRERKDLMLRLQALAAKHSVRVTILGGDVHLAALGKFYSSLKSEPKPTAEERDPRYMVNIISSAITNKPPPKAVANLLARRNKVHHLDHHTDETLIDLFKDHDVDDPEIKRLLGEKRANTNYLTMPSRNYAIIEESSSSKAMMNGSSVNGAAATTNGTSATSQPGSLQCSFKVEINQHDREGRTHEYPFQIPGLKLSESEREALVRSVEKSSSGWYAAHVHEKQKIGPHSHAHATSVASSSN